MTDDRRFGYFRLLVTGYAISSFGSFVNFVALNLFAYQVTGSALHTGLFMALRLASGFAAGLVAGHLVTRYSRKALMIGSDLGQAAGLLSLALAPAGLAEGLLYPLAVVLGIGRTLFTVSLRSSVPEMVGAESRVRANALLVTGRSIAMVAGFASAGLIVAVFGFRTAFLVDGVSFLFSAATLALVPLTMRASGDAATSGSAGGFAHSWRSARLVFAAAPVLGVMVLIRFVDAFGSASHNVGLPIYAAIVNAERPATFMSLFWGSWAVGTLLVSQVLGRYVRRAQWLTERAFAVGTVAMSVFFVMVFLGLPLPLVIAAAMLAGAADGFTEIAYTSRLQAIPDDRRGFVFGFSAMAESSGFGLGMVASAVVLESLSPPVVVGIFHGIAMVCALAFLAVLRIRFRGTARAGEPDSVTIRET